MAARPVQALAFLPYRCRATSVGGVRVGAGLRAAIIAMSCAAMSVTSCTRLSARHLSSIALMWSRTVCSLMQSSAAMRLLVRPSKSRRAMACWRHVKRSRGLGFTPPPHAARFPL